MGTIHDQTGFRSGCGCSVRDCGCNFAADVTTLDCINFNVTLEPEDAAAIQERYGEQSEFEKVVCVTAAQLPIDEYTEPTRVDVVVKPIDYHLMVLVEKLEHNK